MPKDVLLLGHHLRSKARASKSSWRPNPYQVESISGSSIMIKLKLSFLIHWSIFWAFAQHKPFMTFVVEFI
jgi:hypothetical protein